TPTLFRAQHKLRIEYPKKSRKRPLYFNVHSMQQVEQVLNSQFKKYIGEVIFGYAKQRQHALSSSMSIAETYAFSRIHDALIHRDQYSLRGIAVRVNRLKPDLELIAPGYKSRFRQH